MTPLALAVLESGLSESSKLWPLEVCCTVGKEDCRQTQCVDHGEQTTPLTLPVLLGTTQTRGIVEYSTGEGLSPPCPAARPGTTEHLLGVA